MRKTDSLSFEQFNSYESTATKLGEAHRQSIGDLDDKGMFDTWLSDSRLGNWHYDAKADKLYKLDENIQVKGSRFGCLARIADFDHVATEDERDEMLKEMNPENMEDAYLSLYITNIESALGFKDKIGNGTKDAKVQELYEKRIETARGYLDRLDASKYENLREEFDSTFESNDDAYSRAA